MALADLANNNDRDLGRTAMAIVALATGDRDVGALLAYFDSSEIREVLAKYLAWGNLYRP